MSDVQRLSAALAGRYAIEREVGAGGMATVFLARDLRHERTVAIKVLGDEQAVSLGAERFTREIKLLARLRHPFVLPLHDSGSADGLLWFVMPYIDGESLRARLARGGAVPLAEALVVVRQVADALDYAHAEGVVHRDVKPENILLSRHGHALLADFGIARQDTPSTAGGEMLTQAGMAVGTAAYMSPEQALGEAGLDGRSDLYALGCVTYEMLAGVPPFVGASAFALAAQHIGTPAPSLAAARPDLPLAVVDAVARALAKEPAARFATTAEFVRALSASEPQHSGPTAVALPQRLSIAVLPVVNRSTDAEAGFFSEGMTEELINSLAKVQGLRVTSRTSTVSFASSGLSVEEIGVKLGVGFLVEGSVRRAGNRLRMTARLIQAADGSTLWSETYERQLEDVFAVQDDITRRIVETVTEALQLGGLRGSTQVAQPRTLAAYDLYLLGRHHWTTRTEASMRRALELFEEAAALDPDYAPAQSGIADASALLASWQFAAPDQMYPRAVQAARRAIALDPSSADAHASLGFVHMNWDLDWEATEREFRAAIAINPNHETAHRWLSAFLAGIGRFDEGVALSERVLRIDPVSVLPQMNLGICLYFAARYTESEAAFRRALAISPDFVRAHAFLGCVLELDGQVDAGIAAMRHSVQLSGTHATLNVMFACMLARAGRMDDAQAAFALNHGKPVQPIYAAMWPAVTGDVEQAIDHLERGYAERSDWMYTIGVQPWFLSFHDHPRFRALMATMRLGTAAVPAHVVPG
jgi:serine/threonine-protein kinase